MSPAKDSFYGSQYGRRYDSADKYHFHEDVSNLRDDECYGSARKKQEDDGKCQPMDPNEQLTFGDSQLQIASNVVIHQQHITALMICINPTLYSYYFRRI